MHPIHDIDALLLLAVGLASKRRPAELSEVVAAAELIQGAIPAAPKLAEAFSRLSAHGLLCESGGRFALTGAAQTIVTGLPKKADSDERIFTLKQKLYGYEAAAEHPPIEISEAQVVEAVATHHASAQGSGKNMMMPRPKPAEGEVRRPAGGRKPFFRGRRG
jgi:hypothetical protein